MAKVTISAASRNQATTPTHLKAKPLKIGIDAGKYVGLEPTFENVELTEDNRKLHCMNAFNWYNYNFKSKDASAFIVEYLTINKRTAAAKSFKRVPDHAVPNAYGWLARMTSMGYVLNEAENEKLEAAIEKGIAAIPAKDETVEAGDETQVKKFNIQERMREKLAEAGGEVEGMLDEYIASGASARHEFVPINILKAANILPAHVPGEVEHFTKVCKEFKEAYTGKDTELKKAYSHLSKIQLRNIIKFVELIIADYQNYVAFKKANKKVRKRKVKSPIELARKLKFMPEDTKLKIKSEKPSKIVGAKEMYVYNVKKRKLMYFVADEFAGGLSIKNNTVIGFDPNKSIQKTIRKPKDQLKVFMAANKPNSRKIFANTKSVESKFSGRFSDDILILKVW